MGEEVGIGSTLGRGQTGFERGLLLLQLYDVGFALLHSALGFAAAGLLASAVGQTPCARLCRLYFEGTRLCGSVLVLYFFITFLSTALLLLAGNGGFA